MKRLLILASSALAILSVSTDALAQSKKEMVAKDVQLEQRISDLEGRMLTGDPAAERLMQRMDSLEAAQRALTGEIEQLRYERDTLRTDVETLAKDIEAMQAIATEMRAHLDMAGGGGFTSPPLAGGQPLPAVPHNNSQGGGQTLGAPLPIPAPQDQGQSFQMLPPVQSTPMQAGPIQPMGAQTVDASELMTIGQQKLRSGDFTGAQLAYRQYIDVNPNAPDTGEAYFWLGETYYVKSGFDKAAESYIASMRADPKGELAPSAMIGLAGALRGMGNKEGACQTLDGFPVQFPDASADMQSKASRERQRSGCP